ncbi:MAG: prephenate/arogenate dehydrogenase family protein [Rhizobiales bacterium]|nr:prephenate/arogenate dehydrogenase family protein [Hyphomicrobiales bacterium]NRB14709.1 prephenate/arogenate dehydrogenase family protein [Hyphomicrobiales bacterium]
MNDFKFEKIAIIGLGLMGSSLALVIKQRDIANLVMGFDISEAVRKRAAELEFCDAIVDDVAEAVEQADLVIMAVPVGVTGEVAASFISHMKKGAILTDVGSVKQAVIEQVSPLLADNDGIHFIASHPIAGSELSGPDAGFATIFDNKWTIITPLADVDTQKLDELKRFWTACGSNIEILDAKHHDKVLAVTSHIPQLISYNMVGTAADVEEITQTEVIKYSAGGFRDFTRLAASDPTMWRDVFLHNKEAVLEMLACFNEDLVMLQRAIRRGDGDILYEFFARTQNMRNELVDAGQEVAGTNFGRDENANKADDAS